MMHPDPESSDDHVTPAISTPTTRRSSSTSSSLYNRLCRHKVGSVLSQQRQRIFELFQNDNPSEEKIHAPSALILDSNLHNSSTSSSGSSSSSSSMSIGSDEETTAHHHHQESNHHHHSKVSLLPILEPLKKRFRNTQSNSTYVSKSESETILKRRLRFSLRAALVLVTVALIASSNFFGQAWGAPFLLGYFYYETSPHAKDAYTQHVIQLVVASPSVGYLDVIGTTHALCGDHDMNYTDDDLVLSLSTSSAKYKATNVVVQQEAEKGSGHTILLARFLVGRTQWRDIILQNAATATVNSTRTLPTAMIVDRKRQGRATGKLPIWIDPALVHYYSNLPSTISNATITLTPMTSFNTTSPQGFMGVATIIRSDESSHISDADVVVQLQSQVQTWVQHYRDLGVEQFYIVDNVPSSEPSIHLQRHIDAHGVTYIRASNEEYPYEDVDCQGVAVFPGQWLLEHAVLKAANVEWMLFC
jgi:hypothetical protein